MKFKRPDKPPFAHAYGWITPGEAKFVDKLLLRIFTECGSISFLEIGVFGGSTVAGVYEWAEAHNCPVHCEGVDLAQGRPVVEALPGYVFHQGDSMDAWRTFTGTFNLLWVDGCHCINHSMMDFLNYSPFVQVGGYCLFHDTAGSGPDNVQGAYAQNHSYAGQPPSVLGVRLGLQRMGLLQGHRTDWTLVDEIKESEIMGMMVFKKVKPL